MSIWELFVIALALSMDAFAVSICKGLSAKRDFLRAGLICGAWFGFFQALMPLLGWLLGQSVASYIDAYSAYIAFALLVFLGGKMIFEAISEEKERREARERGVEVCACCGDEGLGAKVMFPFAIATSIDALAAGLSLSALGANIWIAISFIGVVTFVLCFVGAAVGSKLGARFSTKAEMAGGAVLIILGIKILIEHFVA